MTTNPSLKRVIKQRMAATGEPYNVARRRLTTSCSNGLQLPTFEPVLTPHSYAAAAVAYLVLDRIIAAHTTTGQTLFTDEDLLPNVSEMGTLGLSALYAFMFAVWDVPGPIEHVGYDEHGERYLVKQLDEEGITALRVRINTWIRPNHPARRTPPAPTSAVAHIITTAHNLLDYLLAWLMPPHTGVPSGLPGETGCLEGNMRALLHTPTDHAAFSLILELVPAFSDRGELIRGDTSLPIAFERTTNPAFLDPGNPAAGPWEFHLTRPVTPADIRVMRAAITNTTHTIIVPPDTSTVLHPYLRAASREPWNRIPLGVDATGQQVVLDIDSHPGVLIAGRTGTGTSTVKKGILAHVLGTHDWLVLAHDPMRRDISDYAPGAAMLITDDLDAGVNMLTLAVDTITERERDMHATGVTHFRDLTDNHGSPIPAVMVIIDEAFELFAPEQHEHRDGLHTQAKALTTHIATNGPVAGVYVVLFTQRPDLAVIGDVATHLNTRIVMGSEPSTVTNLLLSDGLSTRTSTRSSSKGQATARIGDTIVQYHTHWVG